MQTSIRPDAPLSAPPLPAIGGASEKLASGPQTTYAEPKVWQTQTFTDESRQGNDYMHARYYNPNLGRFLSVDPVGGSVGSSQSWNMYGYVLGNPLKYTDPRGLKVKVLDDQSLEEIRATLPEEIRENVILDDSGYIDSGLINAIESDNASFLNLKEVVNANGIVEVSTGSGVTYVDSQGNEKNEAFIFLPATENFPTTNMFLGLTAGPISGSNPHDTREVLSTNANVQVTLANISGVPRVEMNRTTAEELYGHARLYLAGKPFLHGQPDVNELISSLHARYP